MSTPAQRQANESVIAEVVAAAAHGNPAAADYLVKIAAVARVIDDLEDGDTRLTKPDVLAAWWTLLVELPRNPFFRAHAETLTAMHAVALNAWADSNAMERTDERENLYRHVLRDMGNELVPTVAYLTGGYKAMRSESLAIRRAFMKPLTEKKG